MGYTIAYSNKQIIVYECDVCNKHCIVVERKTGNQISFNDK